VPVPDLDLDVLPLPLGAQATQFEDLLELIDGVVWQADPVTLLTVYVGPKLTKMLGYTRRQYLEEPAFWESKVHPDDQARAIEETNRALEEGRPYRLEYRFLTAAGHYVWLRDIVTPVRENGHLVALGGVMMDVTEQTEAQAALESSEQRARSSEKLASLGRLTAGLAHEINTPLAATMNYLRVAQSLAGEYQESIGTPGVTDDDHREIAAELLVNLTEAQKTAGRIGEFIRQMRGHTRDTVNGVTEFDPQRMAQDALIMLAHEARDASVTLDLQPAPQRLELRGEPGRFTQVITNLVVNAIHACDSRVDGGEVRVSFTGEDPLLMHVQDNGSGIGAEVLAQIFEPMFTTKGVGKGTGLGLSIIQDIMKGQFGGEITVQTTPGEGSTFTAAFPKRVREDASGR